MPAACGGDRPRGPPDGGIRAGGLPQPPAQAATEKGDVDEVFPLRCPRRGEPMRLIAFVTDRG
jgi:hypothetical protein